MCSSQGQRKEVQGVNRYLGSTGADKSEDLFFRQTTTIVETMWQTKSENLLYFRDQLNNAEFFQNFREICCV